MRVYRSSVVRVCKDPLQRQFSRFNCAASWWNIKGGKNVEMIFFLHFYKFNLSTAEGCDIFTFIVLQYILQR